MTETHDEKSQRIDEENVEMFNEHMRVTANDADGNEWIRRLQQQDLSSSQVSRHINNVWNLTRRKNISISPTNQWLGIYSLPPTI